jgi:hypothetical protein
VIVGCLDPWWRSRYPRLCRQLRSRNPQVPRAPVTTRGCRASANPAPIEKICRTHSWSEDLCGRPSFHLYPYVSAVSSERRGRHTRSAGCIPWPSLHGGLCLPACVAPAAPGSMRPIAPKTTLKYEFESRAVGARAIRCWFPSGPSLIWFCLLPSALARPLGRTRALRVPYRRDTCVEGPPSCSLHSLLSTAFNSSYLRAAGWPSTQRIALRCPVRFAKEVLKSDSNHMHS